MKMKSKYVVYIIPIIVILLFLVFDGTWTDSFLRQFWVERLVGFYLIPAVIALTAAVIITHAPIFKPFFEKNENDWKGYLIGIINGFATLLFVLLFLLVILRSSSG